MKMKFLVTLFLCFLLASSVLATTTITVVKTGELDCDGTTVAFSFSFPYAATSEITVDVITDAGDVASRQAETTNYTVSPSSSSSGGTVTFSTAPADGNYVIISRTTSLTQDNDIDAGAYTSRTAIENALDEIYRILQEHDDAITRSIRAPQEEVTTDMKLSGALARAGGYLMFSASGALTLGTAFVPTGAAVSAFMETVLDDATAAAARTTLGAYGANDSPTFTAVRTNTLTFANGQVISGATDNRLEITENSETFALILKTNTIELGTDSGIRTVDFNDVDRLVGIESIQYDEDCLSKVMATTVQLTNANIKALRATSKEIVAAPGADYAVIPIQCVLILDYGSNVLTESADNLQLSWNNGTTAIGAAIEATDFITASADTITTWVNAQDEITAAALINNKNVTLDNIGDGEYGGNASADTTIRATLYYRVIKLGL